jgi:hypothetical protein
MDAIRDGRIKWGTPPRWLESNAANRNKSVNTSINKIETGTKMLSISLNIDIISGCIMQD